MRIKKKFDYAIKLTRNVENINKSDIEDLKNQGLSEREIVEINQVVAYTNYTNRVTKGLGL